MASLDEELQAYYEELERQRQEERRRQQLREAAKTLAKQQVRRVAKKAAKRLAVAGGRAAASAIASVAGALAPYLLPVIAIIAAAGLVILITVTVIYAVCNAGGFTGRLATVTSAVGGALGVPGGGWCEAVSGLKGIVTTIDQGQIPPPGGEFCARQIRAPAGFTIDCRDCIDLRSRGVPIKPPPGANPFASPRLADRLARLVSINSTFRITEAFCPTINHASHDHYNGLAVDINLKPEFAGDRQKLAKLYNDARSLGFRNVLCEYRAGLLDNLGIRCQAEPTTEAGHIHIEEPHAD